MKIELSPRFKKSFKKLITKRPGTSINVLEKILLFSQDPYNPVLEMHKLKGFENVWSFSVETDLRILVDLSIPSIAYFMIIGTHDEVY